MGNSNQMYILKDGLVINENKSWEALSLWHVMSLTSKTAISFTKSGM